MSRDTLNRKRCKTCNKWFAVGTNVELLEDYCSDCETKGWLTDMRNKGCSVGNPDKLGDMPYIQPKTLKECPEIEIDGVGYRDVTTLMFEDGKITKTYPTQAEWAEIKRSKGLSIERKGVQEKAPKRKRFRLYTAEDEEKIIEMYLEGAYIGDIAAALKRTERAISEKLIRLRKEGRII